MAHLRSYTSLEQSKVLAEILPLESADMYWDLLSKDNYAKVNNIGNCLGRTCVCAWSLAALLGILPPATLDVSNDHYFKIHCMGKHTVWYGNPVDACYDMILKLHEQNII